MNQCHCSEGLIAAIIYGAVAIGANFVTKHAMKVLDLPNLILLVQMLAMAGVVQLARSTGLVHARPFSMQRCRRLMPLALAFTAHAALVMRSLAILNIAIYNTLKRLTPIMVLCAKVIIDRKLPDVREACAVCMVVAGCLIAGFGDLSFDACGYALALICACLQASYILLTEYAEDKPSDKCAPLQQHDSCEDSLALLVRPDTSDIAQTYNSTAPKPRSHSPSGMESGASNPCFNCTASSGSGKAVQEQHAGGRYNVPPSKRSPGHHAGLSAAFDVLLYITAWGVPLAAIACLCSAEHQVMEARIGHAHSVLGGGPAFSLWLTVIAFNELALTGTMVWCTQSNCALTTTIVGVLKSTLAVPLGIMFMAGDAKFGTGNIVGMTVVALGGSWYAAIKAGWPR